MPEAPPPARLHTCLPPPRLRKDSLSPPSRRVGADDRSPASGIRLSHFGSTYPMVLPLPLLLFQPKTIPFPGPQSHRACHAQPDILSFVPRPETAHDLHAA